MQGMKTYEFFPQIISGLKQEIKLKDELLQKAQEEFGDKAVNNARFERNLVKSCCMLV